MFVVLLLAGCDVGFESTLPSEAALNALGPTDACVFAVEANTHFRSVVTAQEFCTLIAQAAVPATTTDFPGTCMPVFTECLDVQLASPPLPLDATGCPLVPMVYTCPETVAQYSQCLDTMGSQISTVASYGCRERAVVPGLDQLGRCAELIGRCAPALVDDPTTAAGTAL